MGRQSLITLATGWTEQSAVMLLAAIVLCVAAYELFSRLRFKRRVNKLLAGAGWMSTDVFLRATKMSAGAEFEGCYVLHNATKDIYYVGQAKSVSQRVKNHFAGRGNGDVYADYRYGDAFEICTVPLARSGYTSLNALERDLISRYDAFSCGYNRTRGNHD